MFCSYCGKEIPDNAKFCHICGAERIPEEEMKEPEGEKFSEPIINEENLSDTEELPRTEEKKYQDEYKEGPVYTESEQGFFDIVKHTFKNWDKLKGRASRKEFWSFFLVKSIVSIMYIIGFAAVMLWGIAGYSKLATCSLVILGILSLGTYVFLLVPSISVFVRRLHDSGNDGALVILCFIPCVGNIATLVFALLEGEAGPNKYGMPPKF